jgi:hypothetical protein
MKLTKKIKKALSRTPPKQDYGLFWQRLLNKHRGVWQQARRKAKNGPRVLIATSTGSHGMATPVESLLGVALTLRGADVHFLLCDQFLPICSMALATDFDDLSQFLNAGPSSLKCPKCFKKGRSIYRPLGLPIHLYSQHVTPDEAHGADETAQGIPLIEIPEYRWKGIAVGEHALAGALRFFARGDLNSEPFAEPVLRWNLKAAILTTCVLENLLENLRFDCTTFHHGIYVPQGLIGEVARREGVRVVNWLQAYRKRCFIFSHDDTYHHTMMAEPTDRWMDMSWNDRTEEQLLVYLKSRWKGTKDWISFHEEPQFDLQSISQEIGVDFSNQVIGMLTNVMWDAQLHYPANAFPNMRQWVIQTIDYFANRPDLQLLIRVHPAELTGIIPSRQRIEDEIKKAFPSLPGNIFLIPPESHASTYAAMLQCDTVIIYGTKTGVELTSMGVPVIVAGEAWIRNKGITMDANSVEEYLALLDRLPLEKRLDKATTERARKYAFHFFFRRMIPVEFFQPSGGWPPYNLVLNSLDALRPGTSKGLDVICDGILKATDFIYPAERVS